MPNGLHTAKQKLKVTFFVSILQQEEDIEALTKVSAVDYYKFHYNFGSLKEAVHFIAYNFRFLFTTKHTVRIQTFLHRRLNSN
jgi:hypothetical protein